METIINQYFQMMAAMDAVGWKSLFASDAVVYDPVGKPPSHPHQDAEKFFNLLSNFFESITITQDHLFQVPAGAAVKWTMEVKTKNGRGATSEGISVFEFNGAGEIQKLSTYWHEAEMMAKLRN